MRGAGSTGSADSLVMALAGLDDVAEAPPEIPPLDRHDLFVPLCFFRHISEIGEGGPVPIAEMTPIQQRLDDARSAFRVDEDGRPIPGSDLVMKPRRGKLSTWVYRRILHAALKLGGLRIVTILHTQTPDVIDEALGNVLFALERFPPGWVKVRRRGRGPLVPMEDVAEARQGNSLRFCGCKWDFTTAGDRAVTASKRGRSGAIHILHLSEVREFREPARLMAAVGAAAKIWRVAESNPPNSPGHWMEEEFAACEAGVGAWGAAHFFAWHDDPSNAYPPGSPEYETTMAPGFPLAEADREAEDRLRLSLGQRAFRRHWRSTGSTASRRLNRAEYPESRRDAYVIDGVPFLDAEALDVARAQALASTPLRHYRVGAALWVSLWVDPAEFIASGRRVVLGCDTAELYGRDNTAIIGRCDRTLDQVVQLHGVAAWHDVAGALRDVLRDLVGLSRTRYMVGIERNHGLGLIAACESQEYRIELYHERIIGADGTVSSRAGVTTGRYNRRRYMSVVTDSVEGSGYETDGTRRALRPTVPFQSIDHVEELASMVVEDHKPQAAEGKKDDLVIADAICLDLIRQGAMLPPPAVSAGSGSRGADSRVGSAAPMSRAQRHVARRLGRR